MLRMNPIHDIVDVSAYSSFHCSRSNKEKNTDVNIKNDYISIEDIVSVN
jgi:hypothetical protein